MWLQIALALIQWLGPILVEWFGKWLDKRLKAKAASMPSIGLFGAADSKGARVALLQAVRDDLWPWQIAKKRMVNQCIEHVQRETVIGADTPVIE